MCAGVCCMHVSVCVFVSVLDSCLFVCVRLWHVCVLVCLCVCCMNVCVCLSVQVSLLYEYVCVGLVARYIHIYSRGHHL